MMGMKIVKWVVGIIVVLLVLALGIFWFELDQIVRRTVETEATQSLQTQTTLGSASVAPIRGKVELADLKIASPPGYSAGDIFTLGDAKVAVSYGQLRQDPIRVETISLNEPVIVLEQKDLKTNIQAMMDRLPKGDDTPASGDAQAMHLIIGDLTIEKPTVILRPGFPGLAQEIKLTLPTIEMKDVGSGEGNKNGAAIKDVVMLVLTEVASKAADSDQLPPEVRELLNVDVKSLAAKMKDQLQVQVEKIGGNILSNPKGTISNTEQKLQQGIGGLFNGRPASRPAKRK
ncbi:MAG TPA: hypothetical protein VFE58_12510 [Tepidisphaeraceae bacterium]|jgi:hypothetical protein|nr:hypothetical protein [Tepidisphaeraceae bacterium]